MADEFITPAFLEEETADDILDRMLEKLPDDIDVSEGSHPYNLLAPVAYEKERMAQFVLLEAIKLIFPKYCDGYDEVADEHAAVNNMTRKAAFYATGTLKAIGEPGTEIKKGSIFSTEAVDETAAIEFESKEDAVIREDGTASFVIQAVEAGSSGNVAAGTIILQDDPVVNEVINEIPTAGGIDEESTASLIARIVEKEMNQDASFIGCDADYKRWAESVNGTGTASVIPAQTDEGIVTIVLTDSTGQPASEALCQAVYDYIMSPDNPLNRLAPITGKIELRVVPPTIVQLIITATIELSAGTTLETVKENFVKNLEPYLDQVHEDMEVRYTKIASVLSNTGGVHDYKELQINGNTTNIPIRENEFPSVSAETITFTVDEW
ncbi:baseplate J/gp47 family protein [Clostridiales Family XIII bacterium ASD5510]|uniref:Baseplate J/gp47 family protein n=1 Tax=Hominibacterium faecale TaxID=2839743 RepID=A0A9J6QYE0_9FIRM|nr:baseplate J/gp47 family protein [Hominibacterium faecale]MCU7380526.1 baseplate J/gp47 family protein [Hominibacterium faecale]